MKLFATPYIYYYTACLIYILSAVICGIVRWFHMCHPYDRKADYFYPGRRQATFFFSALLLQIPYLLYPSSLEAWTFVRIFGILYYPVCFSMLFLRFFHGEERHKHMRRATIAILPMSLLLLEFVEASGGGLFSETMKKAILYVIGSVGLCCTVYLANVTQWLKKRINNYQQNHYSNDEDFPYNFALQVLYIPLVWVLVMWVVFLTDSPTMKSVADLMCAVMHVWLLINILHPHWSLQPKQTKTIEKQQNALVDEIIMIRDKEADRQTNNISKKSPKAERLTPEQKEELREKVIAMIKEQELFKQPNLTTDNMANLMGSNSTYIYEAFGKNKGGTFYQIVNKMRVEYCKELLYKNPNLDQYDLMVCCGFNSLSTFYRVFKTFTGKTPKAWIRVKHNGEK